MSTPSTAAVPMPQPAWPGVREPMSGGRGLMYTADQMRTYADACAQQARREAMEAAKQAEKLLWKAQKVLGEMRATDLMNCGIVGAASLEYQIDRYLDARALGGAEK